MKTTNLQVKIDRKTHELDATGQPLGRLATKVAYLLRGKQKATFCPQIDNGDFVIVTNFDKISFSGKKIEQKKYYHYSGYPGGLTTTKLKSLLQTNRPEVLKKAVLKMLPKNKLCQHMINRLTIK